MAPPIASPPLEPLQDVVSRLERAGLVCALGGSGLLASLGLANSVRDWDLTTDEPLERAIEAIEDLQPGRVGPDGLHADHKLLVRGGEIELIVGFAIGTSEDIVRLPTLVTGRWRGVPLGSPEVWAVAYALMERDEKASALFRLLGRRGADPAAVARLAREPLPAALREKLVSLPRRATSSNT